MDDFFNLNIETALITFLTNVAVALGIGLLLGLEREFAKGKDNELNESYFAGIRTFPIVALMGLLAAHLSNLYSPWILVISLAGTFGLTALSYWLDSSEENLGGTSEVALIIVFLLGALVEKGSYLGAVTVAVIVAALLALKVRLHSLVWDLNKSELLSILIMVTITGLVLPLLPNTDFGPYGAFNLYKIWLIVVIFMSLNFTAYFLEKFLGSKNSVLIIGIVGGFASSTATSWFFSRKTGQNSKGGVLEASAIILASSIMFPRVLVWLLILNHKLFYEIWFPMIIFGIIGLGLGYWMSFRGSSEEQVDKSPRQSVNPINFREAFIFAGIYILIQLLVGFAKDQLGDKGVYIASFIAGLTDIDAIAISMSDYQKNNIVLSVASLAVVIAAFSNTLVKYIFCLVFGNNNLKKYSSIGFISLFFAGFVYVIYRLFLAS